MDSTLVVGLVNNTALLLALVLLYDTFARSARDERSRPLQALTGLVLGGIAVAVMANPVRWSQGVIFDTRTVLLSAAGLFFPPLASVVALAVAAAYRFSLGGAGLPMGLATIVSSGAVGVLWQRYRGGRGRPIGFFELYAFGLLVHALMLLSMTLLPQGTVLKTMQAVGVPVLALYPVATALLGGLLSGRAAKHRTEAALAETVAALRQSEARYRFLFEQSPDGVVVLDPDTASFLEFNDQACRQLGYTREEFGRLCIPDVELKETPEDVRARIRRVVEQGEAEFDTVQRTKGGERCHVHVKARYSDAGGGPVYHCIWRDVTEQKRQESLLQARLHLIEYGVSHSVNELLTEALDRAEELTGSRIGFFHFVNEDQRTLTLHAWSTRTGRDFCTAAGTGSHYGVDQAGVWVDCVRERRAVVHNDYASLPHRRGMPPGHAAVNRELLIPVFRADKVVAVLGLGNKPTDYVQEDVTVAQALADAIWEIAARKEAQEALRDSEAKFGAAFDCAPLAITISRLEDGRYLEVNQRFTEVSGFCREEVVGRTAIKLGWMDETNHERLLESLRREGRLRDVELTLRAKTGAEVIGKYWGESITVGGQPCLLAVALDVTEHRKIEQRLRQAQKMEAVGTLAGGIAHDFNNILTPIIAHGELALMQLPQGHPVRDNLTGLLRAAERAAALVRQILAISRKEDAGAPVPVNVGALVKEAAKLLRASIPATIALRVDVDSACAPVLAEPSQVQQVILNLCTNASQAMEERGGVLSLALTRAGAPHGSPGVRLTVSDTGPGIEAHLLPRIFEPYFTTKDVGKGSGLGLATVHGIVGSLGGEIRVRSNPGAGATFEVLLPTTEAEGSAHRPQAEIGTGGGGQQVLVVDDEPAVRDVAARLLASAGYRTAVAASGAEALALFREAPAAFDAVLTDYTMPGMTGTALAAELRSLRPGLPVLLGTGYAADVGGKLSEAVITGVVSKPYSARALREALGSALASAGRSDAETGGPTMHAPAERGAESARGGDGGAASTPIRA